MCSPRETCRHALTDWLCTISDLAACVSSKKHECLRRFGEAGSVLLNNCGGRIETLVKAVDSHFCAPHVGVRCVQQEFGVIKTFPRTNQLLSVWSPGAPVDMCDGDNLDAEMTYGNHPSVKAHRDEITDKIIPAVVLGRALVFDVKIIRKILGLRVSPLGVVEEPKFRSIHDLTFAAVTTIRSSVNDDTDFAQAPERSMWKVLHDILSQVLYLRQLHGVRPFFFIC